MQHSFGFVPRADIPRSSFDRSHGHKTAFDAGYLVPIFVDEALPGDTFSLQATMFTRLATPIVPIMDNIFLETFFFAVPLRLLWDNWKKFNGEQKNPSDSTDYLVPQVTAPADGGWTVGSLSDHLGLPTGINSLSTSAFWHRAYNLIWNEWFRDENLQDSVPVLTGDGPDAPTNYNLLRRNKKGDYFTSALPWPQKGSSVAVPLGSRASIKTDATASVIAGVLDGAGAYRPLFANTADSNNVTLGSGRTGATAGNALYADLSSATASTINTLRQAFQIQKLLERNARGGTRYTEILQSHFGVVSPDARLQRPEYLGGSSSRININQVAQTSPTSGSNALGDLAAFGMGADRFHGFTKSFTEHMVIIGLANVRADITYQQGLPRMFSRKTRYDFYWPALANIGEQSILNKEIYCQGTAADDTVFGYQERWAEYRYKPSIITGKLRSTYSTPLDFWHLSQKFANLPTLNSTFIEDNPPISRAIAVPTEPQFIFDSFFNLKCARPMPAYGIPGLIDHF
nr:MAG: major capsid protein [Microvirus sp.]